MRSLASLPRLRTIAIALPVAFVITLEAARYTVMERELPWSPRRAVLPALTIACIVAFALNADESGDLNRAALELFGL